MNQTCECNPALCFPDLWPGAKLSELPIGLLSPTHVALAGLLLLQLPVYYPDQYNISSPEATKKHFVLSSCMLEEITIQTFIKIVEVCTNVALFGRKISHFMLINTNKKHCLDDVRHSNQQTHVLQRCHKIHQITDINWQQTQYPSWFS